MSWESEWVFSSAADKKTFSAVRNAVRMWLGLSVIYNNNKELDVQDFLSFRGKPPEAHFCAPSLDLPF